LPIWTIAFSFLSSNILVPLASSTMPRISWGFMLSTLVIFPCMMRKFGLLILSWTDWNSFWTVSSVDL
jgi:hypothetical protein